MIRKILKYVAILCCFILLGTFLYYYDLNNKTTYTNMRNQLKSINIINKQNEILLDVLNSLINSTENNYKSISNINEVLSIVANNINDMKKNQITTIENVIKNDKFKKRKLEEKLRYINVELENKTIEATGSGVSIKYNNNFYILTAAHILEHADDIILLKEHGKEITELVLVKLDRRKDLALLKPKNANNFPTFVATISDCTPLEADEIYIVGNPLGIEDVLTEGRIIFYGKKYNRKDVDSVLSMNNFMYFLGLAYFGNSGGGIYNKYGELVGIMSHIIPLKADINSDFYTLGGASDLQSIRSFLKEAVK